VKATRQLLEGSGPESVLVIGWRLATDDRWSASTQIQQSALEGSGLAFGHQLSAINSQLSALSDLPSGVCAQHSANSLQLSAFGVQRSSLITHHFFLVLPDPSHDEIDKGRQ